MNRRYFLVSAGSLFLGQTLAGCNTQRQVDLKIHFLKNSIPVQLLKEFRHQRERSSVISLTQHSQLVTLFEHLQAWKRQSNKSKQSAKPSIPFARPKFSPVADLTTLGDYWLSKAIQQRLIQPLEIENLKAWKQLPNRWRSLVTRNSNGELDRQGKVWAAPYRWGSTVIAYRKDKFKALGWEPTDWEDLWHPQLRRQFSLLNQPRETIGLTLKKLGYSYNEPDLNQIPNLKAELLALNQQVKFYSSKTYLQPLLLGDTWLAVGWSHDIIPLVQRHRNIVAIVPQSGTALWADLWVRPATKSTENRASLGTWTEWVEFFWQPKIAQRLSRLGNAASPTLAVPSDLPLAIRTLLAPNPAVLDRSDFIESLPDAAVKQYRSLWMEIRQKS